MSEKTKLVSKHLKKIKNHTTKIEKFKKTKNQDNQLRVARL